MKFSKEDIGVFVSGATLFNSTEQTFAVLDFAISQGFEIDENELAHTKLDYQSEDGLSYDALEDLDYALEDAIAYLNTQCVEEGVAFTFRDTDFVLIDYNGLDNASEGMVR
jgi:hypothetical protein